MRLHSIDKRCPLDRQLVGGTGKINVKRQDVLCGVAKIDVVEIGQGAQHEGSADQRAGTTQVATVKP